MLPASRIVDALKSFRAEFPTVGLRLHMEALGGVTQLVLDGTAGIGVSGPLPGNAGATGVERIGVGNVVLIPVAAPDHPLARGRNRPGAGREHIQLVLTDRSPLTGKIDFAVVSPRTWRLADLGSKHMLLKEGIGWGNMPAPMVEDDIKAGSLVQLDLPDMKSGVYSLEAIYRSDTPPGPAATWLIERFKSQAESRKGIAKAAFASSEDQAQTQLVSEHVSQHPIGEFRHRSSCRMMACAGLQGSRNRPWRGLREAECAFRGDLRLLVGRSKATIEPCRACTPERRMQFFM